MALLGDIWVCCGENQLESMALVVVVVVFSSNNHSVSYKVLLNSIQLEKGDFESRSPCHTGEDGFSIESASSPRLTQAFNSTLSVKLLWRQCLLLKVQKH